VEALKVGNDEKLLKEKNSGFLACEQGGRMGGMIYRLIVF